MMEFFSRFLEFFQAHPIITTLAVFILPILSLLWKSCQFIYRYLMEDHDVAKTWYSYHYTFGEKGAVDLVQGKWRISQSFIKGYRMNGSHDDGTRFTGTIYSEDGNYLVFLKTRSKPHESFHARYVMHKNRDRPMFGIWVGIDNQRDVAASSVVLTRQPIEDGEEMERIVEHCRVMSENRLMKITPNEVENQH